MLLYWCTVLLFLEKYNDYLKIRGGTIGEATCDRTAKPTDAQCINEETHLINFLSHESEDITKYDWLYVVLMDVVSACTLGDDTSMLYKNDDYY